MRHNELSSCDLWNMITADFIRSRNLDSTPVFYGVHVANLVFALYFALSYHMSLRSEYQVVVSVAISA